MTKKKQATHQLHNNLDNLSSFIQRKMMGRPEDWTIFISKYAREYKKHPPKRVEPSAKPPPKRRKL